jgi:hypothetical protein
VTNEQAVQVQKGGVAAFERVMPQNSKTKHIFMSTLRQSVWSQIFARPTHEDLQVNPNTILIARLVALEPSSSTPPLMADDLFDAPDDDLERHRNEFQISKGKDFLHIDGG